MKTCYLILFYFFISCALATPLVVPTIAVTATQTDSQKSDTPTNAHTVIVTAEQIKQSGAVNLEQVLQGLTSLQVDDLTGDGSQVSISMRGFGGNAAQNSLILLNGMPLTTPDLASVNLNLIPLNSIKKIEIFAGSEAVLFGDQAVGGAINIITNTPTQDSMYDSVTFGSYNSKIYQEGFEVVGKDDLYASVNAKKYSTDNFREHNQNDSEQAYGTVGQQSQQTGWNFYYDLSQQLLQLAGALTAAQVAENPRQAQNNIDFTDTNYQTYQFQQYHWLNDLWQEKFAAMHRQLSSSGVLFDPFQENERENWGQLSLVGLIHSILLTNGISLENANYHLNGVGFMTKDSQQQGAVFSQANMPLLTKLDLILGARAAWQNNQLQTTEFNNSNPTASATDIGLTYQWYPWLQLFLRRATNYRFPKADEEAFTANGVGGLKTQTGVSYELGVHANQIRWNSTASVFVLNLNNELAFNPTPVPSFPFGVNTNLDPTRRIGGLLTFNYQLKQNWLVGVQYMHVSAKFSQGEFQGNDIPFVAENTGSIYSDYQFFNYWSAYAKIVFVGSRFAEGDVANAFPEVPSVTLLNLALRYQRKYIFAVFRINNVFNHFYSAFTSVNTVSTSPFAQQQFFYPAPGRNYWITIGFNLE